MHGHVNTKFPCRRCTIPWTRNSGGRTAARAVILGIRCR